MDNPYLIGIISWFVPGLGHLLQGRMARGIIIGAVIWTMFVIAIISGGAYYPGFGFKRRSITLSIEYFCTTRKRFRCIDWFFSVGKSAAECRGLGDF